MKLDIITPTTAAAAATAAPAPPLVPPSLQSNTMGLGVVPWEKLPASLEVRTRMITDIKPYAQEEDDELVGFMPDVMEELQRVALEKDNITLTYSIDPHPADFNAPVHPYADALRRVAIDCNTTYNELPWDECNQYDLVVGDMWPTVFDRSLKNLFTPRLLSTGLASLSLDDDFALTALEKHRPLKTLEEAHALGAPVCVPAGFGFYHEDLMAAYPNLNIAHECATHKDCIHLLKNCSCTLYVADELMLRYIYVQDEELDVTTEHTSKNTIAWALHARLQPKVQFLIRKWVYDLTASGFLDRLYLKYFSPQRCPVGLAGTNCDQPCDTMHGISDRHGNCVCDSTKWTGEACNVEVLENYNHVPRGQKATSWAMLAVNFAVVVICTVWLVWKRHTPQVTVAQPHFLGLVLLGCVVSTSTIIPLQLQDDCDSDNIAACQAVPFLYSLGFCITFGTLLSKIRRVYRLFKAASQLKRTVVSTWETLRMVGLILVIDVAILVVWSTVDPLEWTRVVLMADKYGNPLTSEGYCTSEHWKWFALAIGVYHFGLMIMAGYMCYVARDVPTEFSEGKFLTTSIVSSIQVFVVGVPVLIIAGANAQISFFVRSTVIFLNDFVILVLVFGNIMYSVHFGAQLQNKTELIQSALRTYREDQESRHSSTKTSRTSGMDCSYTRRGMDSSMSGVGGMDSSCPGMNSSQSHRSNTSPGVYTTLGGVSEHTCNNTFARELDVVEEGCMLKSGSTEVQGNEGASTEDEEAYTDEELDLLPGLKQAPVVKRRRSWFDKQDSTRTL